jgi:hypothetical protein
MHISAFRMLLLGVLLYFLVKNTVYKISSGLGLGDRQSAATPGRMYSL